MKSPRRKKEIGIYCIERIETGEKYIGKAVDIYERMNSNHIGCTALYRSIQKYGKNAFIRYIIRYCKKEDLNFWEPYYIILMNTKLPNGYNIENGGRGGSQFGEANPFYGHKHSKKSREKMSAALSGKNHPDFGKHPSLETRQKRSKSLSQENCYLFATKNPEATSMYYGVSKKIDREKWIYWRATLSSNGKKIHIKQCKTEIEAAQVYDKYIVEHNLPNLLNFPEEYGRLK